jgi:hypothetical protein
MIVGRPATVPHDADALYADVIVPRHMEGPFTYLVPSRLQPRLRIGQLVLVPSSAWIRSRETQRNKPPTVR